MLSGWFLASPFPKTVLMSFGKGPFIHKTISLLNVMKTVLNNMLMDIYLTGFISDVHPNHLILLETACWLLCTGCAGPKRGSTHFMRMKILVARMCYSYRFPSVWSQYVTRGLGSKRPTNK